MNNTVNDFKKNAGLLLLTLPVLIYIFVICYIPMFGVIIAFKNISYDKGILGSPWVGFDNFKFFFQSIDAVRITINTITYNLIFIFSNLLFAGILALLLNEIKKRLFLKIYQTAMFFPFFLSWVVVALMCYTFLSPSYGLLNNLISHFGLSNRDWYTEAGFWRAFLPVVNLWKYIGYYTLILYAALMSVNKEYYEAAEIDGASRFQIMARISIPFLIPAVTILFILSLGNIVRADFGLFYQVPLDSVLIKNTTEVIDVYVYKALRDTGEIGIASAVGLFQSAIGFITIIASNTVIRKYNSENSLF